jgi:hypothetical protein
MSFKPKLWLGVGVVTLAGAAQSAPIDASPALDRTASGLAISTGAPGTAPSNALGSPVRLAQTGQGGEGGESGTAKQGGEGGEGGEGGAFLNAEPDVALVGNLLLVRSHLEVAQALARMGLPDEAAAQALQPIAEQGPALDSMLAARHLPSLDEALRAYSQALAADPGAADTAYGALRAALDAAEAAVPAETRNDPAFRLKVGLRLLRQAAGEYAEAAEDNFESPQEYRHGRGFLLVAEDWLAPARRHLSGSDPEAARAIEDTFGVLSAAMPSWEAPPQPIRSAGEVSGAVSRLEFVAAQLM